MVTAQHPAVALIGGAALAPRRHVVGIHLIEFVDAGAVATLLQDAVGAVAHAVLLGGLGLLGIDAGDGRLVKDTDVQQALATSSSTTAITASRQVI